MLRQLEILDYDFSEEKNSPIAIFQWMKLFIILQYLFQDCGKFMYLGRGILGQRLCSLSSTLGRSDSM